MDKVKIHTEYIKLNDFLKFSGIVGSGGQAKNIIKDGLVMVNNEICTIRGKKLRGGEIVSFNNKTIKVEKNDI